MTPFDKLRAVGKILHGARWQAPIARDIGVSDRTVRRWVADQHAPDWVCVSLSRALECRDIQTKSARKVLEN